MTSSLFLRSEMAKRRQRPCLSLTEIGSLDYWPPGPLDMPSRRTVPRSAKIDFISKSGFSSRAPAMHRGFCDARAGSCVLSIDIHCTALHVQEPSYQCALPRNDLMA